MIKFEFSLFTKDGQRVDGIVISGRDQADAERKLRQMYRYCEIIQCEVKGEDGAGGRSGQTASLEDILTLISR